MLDCEMTYVQTSRHRSDARLYFAVEESGSEIREIAATMSRSRQKELAQEQRRAVEAGRERTREIEIQR